jgi:CPA2 family monovalent cation:H+ antiporter-2
MIALLSGIAMTGTLSVSTVGVTVGKLGIFLVAALVVGLIAVPRLIGYVARFKSSEMLLVTVLGLCFGFALLAAKLGYSVALGAFMIGAVIAEAREIHRVEILIEPVRDMFSAIFFVAIGLLIDPKILAEHWLPTVVITLAVVVGKIMACTFGAFVSGNDSRTSLRVGMGLAQIGEFSFIIASLGLTLNVTSKFLYPIAVAVSAITTLLTPYLIKSADSMVNGFGRIAPRSLVNPLGVYTQWVGQVGRQRHTSMATKLARRWFAQMGLNAALIAAVFMGAAFVARRPPGWLKDLHFRTDTLKAALWLSAMVLSLPLFIATLRKLQALGLLIAETRVTQASAAERTAAIRDVVAQSVPIAGGGGAGVVRIGAQFRHIAAAQGSDFPPGSRGDNHLVALAFVHQGLLESPGGFEGNARATAAGLTCSSAGAIARTAARSRLRDNPDRTRFGGRRQAHSRTGAQDTHRSEHRRH